MDPLVVTLAIDDEHQTRFDAERARLFPAGRTVVGAHVTLFHAVPGDELDLAVSMLTEVSSRAPFLVDVTSVVSLGTGAAYRLSSDELDGIHERLRSAFAGRLTRQDEQPFRPHVTVQNKAEVDVVMSTLAQLRAAFTPFRVQAVGIDLWRYAGGPWVPLDRFRFLDRYR